LATISAVGSSLGKEARALVEAAITSSDFFSAARDWICPPAQSERSGSPATAAFHSGSAFSSCFVAAYARASVPLAKIELGSILTASSSPSTASAGLPDIRRAAPRSASARDRSDGASALGSASAASSVLRMVCGSFRP